MESLSSGEWCLVWLNTLPSTRPSHLLGLLAVPAGVQGVGGLLKGFLSTVWALTRLLSILHPSVVAQAPWSPSSSCS